MCFRRLRNHTSKIFCLKIKKVQKFSSDPLFIRVYRHDMVFLLVCTLFLYLDKSHNLFPWSYTGAADSVAFLRTHSLIAAQRQPEKTRRKPRRRKWPLEKTTCLLMNLYDFIVFVENLFLQIVGDICNCK